MSVKKLSILGAAGLASVVATAALAGGPEVIAPVPDYSGVYIQGDLGVSWVKWNRYFPNTRFSGNSRFAAGGSIGYQWSRFLAAEFGGYWISRTSFNTFNRFGRFGRFNNNGRIRDWFVYLAGKIMAPMPWVDMDNLDVFFKAGAAYRPVRISGSRNACGPLFGLGLQYYFNPNWYVKGQYLYVSDMSRRIFINRFSGTLPAINLFTIGLGYKFQL